MSSSPTISEVINEDELYIAEFKHSKEKKYYKEARTFDIEEGSRTVSEMISWGFKAGGNFTVTLKRAGHTWISFKKDYIG